MFLCFDRHVTDGQSDRRTPHDGIGRACIASRDNKKKMISGLRQKLLCVLKKLSMAVAVILHFRGNWI